MYRTFNCGVGMIIAVDAKDAEQTIQILTENGESAWQIGTIEADAASIKGAAEKFVLFLLKQ